HQSPQTLTFFRRGGACISRKPLGADLHFHEWIFHQIEVPAGVFWMSTARGDHHIAVATHAVDQRGAAQLSGLRARGAEPQRGGPSPDTAAAPIGFDITADMFGYPARRTVVDLLLFFHTHKHSSLCLSRDRC